MIDRPIVLTGRDFLPKRPTRASALAAAPAFAVALFFLGGLLVPGHTGDGWLETAMGLEFLLLWALFLMGGVAAANTGLVRYILVGWYGFVFLAIAALIAFWTRDLAPLVGFALVLAGKWRIFFAQDMLVERELLWVRSLICIAAGYALLVPAAFVGSLLAWGVLYFALTCAMELTRVLVPDPLTPA